MIFEDCEYVVFRFATNEGFECCIRKIEHYGSRSHFCGYVALANAHPLFGYEYESSIPVWKLEGLGGSGLIETVKRQIYINGIDVHGGISYAWDHEGSWTLGFDTDHGQKFSLEETIVETKRFSEQLGGAE